MYTTIFPAEIDKLQPVGQIQMWRYLLMSMIRETPNNLLLSKGVKEIWCLLISHKSDHLPLV